MYRTPVALAQLAANPAPLLLLAVAIVALAFLVRFLYARPRGWRLSDLTLAQACALVALVALLSGMGWGLLYDSSTIQGTLTSYLAGLTSITFCAALAAAATLVLALVARPLLRLRLGFLAVALLLAGLVWCAVALGSFAQVW